MSDPRPSPLASWVEAMRLRTLPVSVAGVLCAWGYYLAWALRGGRPEAIGDAFVPGSLCLLFAILAQVASNFANEYYDWAAGLDRAGRQGPRRGVTEGDITPRAMLRATWLTLGAACAVGLGLVWWGGWWLVPAGMVIALGVVAYSAGPWPLSRHAMGEVAVVAFFGVVPVCLTFYIMSGGAWSLDVALGSVAVGLMGANVLMVNNYRDRLDDASVGKVTLAVRVGERAALRLYLLSGIAAMGLLVPTLLASAWLWAVPGVYLPLHLLLWRALGRRRGAAINPLLGLTACLLLLTVLLLALLLSLTAR